ncbi:MAG: SGNH/GDSL hydrolase family protein [Opitutales bacterium]|nr:SGNH/GDSL hydrolase family protein [Opitutales bacterium]
MRNILFQITATLLISAIYLSSEVGQNNRADPQNYLHELSKELVKTWPKNRTINIVCHGHSVPAGYFKTPKVDTFSAYPHLLHRKLKERYPNAVINVIVTSIGGEASDKGASRFEETVLNHKPDLITIDYSLNDRGLGLAKADAAWRNMIEQAQEKDIPIILLTPTIDSRSNLQDPKDPLNQQAEQVRNLAAEYGVGLVDSLKSFKAYVKSDGPMEDLLSQINHPNRKGHAIVANGIMEWFPE